MDNLTHALVGAAIAKAGAERATPLAAATLVVAANAPDMDVLSYARGTYFALSFRRGITHGWPALLVLPFLVTGAVLAWDRWVRLRRRPGADPVRAGPTFALSAIGVATHPTLDWMNTYGMRWALPFDGTWGYGDALFIIDPWIWLVLGGAVFLAVRPDRGALAAWIATGVAASILVLAAMPGARLGWVVGIGIIAWLYRSRPRAAGWSGRSLVAGAVGTVALYVSTLFVLDGVARRDVREAALDAGITPSDVMVSPRGGSLLVSDVEILTDEGYVPGVHRWLASPRVELEPEETVPLVDGPRDVSPGDLDDIVARAREAPTVHDYLVWSRYPFVRIVSDGENWLVRFSDARYDGLPGRGGLGGVEVLLPRP